jgi:hypothetical protein
MRRLLQKDARQRLGDIRDARFALEEAHEQPFTPPLVSKTSHAAWPIAFGVAVVTVAVMAVPITRRLREAAPLEMRVEINMPRSPAPVQFALSPDGRYIAFVASGDGLPRLWLRALDKTTAQPMPGTDGAQLPFWSADSRSIAFFTSGRLYRVDILGGAPQGLAGIAIGRGGTWNAEDVILFTPNSVSPVMRISANGGESTAVTRLAPGQLSHRFPRFFPDGYHFLFYVNGTQDMAGVYLASLDGGESKRLTAADSAGTPVTADRIAFVRQGTLLTQALNMSSGRLTGDPVVLADHVALDGNLIASGFRCRLLAASRIAPAVQAAPNSAGSTHRAHRSPRSASLIPMRCSTPSCLETVAGSR